MPKLIIIVAAFLMFSGCTLKFADNPNAKIQILDYGKYGTKHEGCITTAADLLQKECKIVKAMRGSRARRFLNDPVYRAAYRIAHTWYTHAGVASDGVILMECSERFEICKKD